MSHLTRVNVLCNRMGLTVKRMRKIYTIFSQSIPHHLISRSYVFQDKWTKGSGNVVTSDESQRMCHEGHDIVCRLYFTYQVPYWSRSSLKSSDWLILTLSGRPGTSQQQVTHSWNTCFQRDGAGTGERRERDVSCGSRG